MNPEDNDLLTRVEGDAPMGRLLRENYWVPALLACTLEAGGAPQRARLIGRDYVIFRGHSGRVGCFDEGCPHRGVSLALGRIEDDALRCIFHGWKFSVEGHCVAIPTQVGDEAAACKRVKVATHPTHEAAGIVWVWLGAGEPAPFPDFEFVGLPQAQFQSTRQKVPYNWVQGVEGTMDSAHVTMLHQDWLTTLASGAGGFLSLARKATAPRYDIDEQPYGFRYAALRTVDEDRVYTRVNVFIRPWYGLICPGDSRDGFKTAIFSVPCDDTHSLHFNVLYNTYKPLESSAFTRYSDPDDFPPLPPGGADEVWGQDRALMKQGSATGFRHIVTEDFAVAMSQGPIADRSKEQLNSGDIAVVRLRRQLLEAAKAVPPEGRVPELAEADCSVAHCFADILAPGTDWRSLVDESSHQPQHLTP